MRLLRLTGVKYGSLLESISQDVGVRQFLLTNLQKPESSESWSFRIPVSLIKRYMSQIGDFPYEASDRTWDGKTLFVKGTKSKYINRRNKPLCNVSEAEWTMTREEHIVSV
jgi:hypothetical protein